MKYALYIALAPLLMAAFVCAMVLSLPFLMASSVADLLGDEAAAEWLDDHSPVNLIFDRAWVK